MNKFRGYTPASQLSLGQKQATQMIGACGMDEKSDNNREK